MNPVFMRYSSYATIFFTMVFTTAYLFGKIPVNYIAGYMMLSMVLGIVVGTFLYANWESTRPDHSELVKFVRQHPDMSPKEISDAYNNKRHQDYYDSWRP